MSELKAHNINDLSLHDIANCDFYIKADADKFISNLEESHKMEVEQLLMEIVELKKQVHDYAQGLYVMQARAEKEARHQKYRRCLAMADFCDSQYDYFNTLGNGFWLVRGDTEKRDEYRKKASDFWWKWSKRWLELAEKFKEYK